MPGLMVRTIVDDLLEIDGPDWLGEAKRQIGQLEQIAAKADRDREVVRKTGTRPSHELAVYAGTYRHPGYGDVEIRLAGDRLEAVFNDIVTPLAHWHYDVFNGERNPDDPTFENTKYQFRNNLNGAVADLLVPFEASLPPRVFERLADARLSDPEFLATLAGKYAIGPQIANIRVQGDRLTLSLPGQPLYTLEPERDLSFTLKDLDGFRLIFELEDGVVARIRFDQPNGVFTATPLKD